MPPHFMPSRQAASAPAAVMPAGLVFVVCSAVTICYIPVFLSIKTGGQTCARHSDLPYFKMPRREVVSRSSLSFSEPRSVGEEDVQRVLARAVRVQEGKIVRAALIRWTLDSRQIVDPVGSWGSLLEADVEMVLEG